MEALAMKIGESIISAVITKLVDKAASSDLLKYARKQNVEAEIKKWHRTLIKINAVLADAEQKQATNEAVKEWLRDLKSLVYDVEDALDQFNYEALRCKFTAPSQASTSKSKNKIRALIPSCCTNFSPAAVISNVRIGSTLEEITLRLGEIIQVKNDLGLTENVSVAKLVKGLPTSPLVDPSLVYGREADQEKIVQLLIRSEASSQLTIVPIIGMAGLGKTTLAKLAYQDDRVKADLKAWVCVSDNFDIFEITKSIWQYVTSEPCHFETIALLQEKLMERLSGKKFFIVLDDVWNENVGHWEALCQPFRTGVAGCKLIVTTRNEGVVSTMDATLVYRLQHLPTSACVSLMESYALGAETFAQFPGLKDVATQIVEKCGRLPLAVKTLAGHLRKLKRNPHEWEAVLRSDIWDLPGEQNDVLPALKLSYHYLSARLKCCFIYCSLFPKDYEFDKNELVLLWVAEGFIHQHKKKEIVDLGCEYFDELLSRSFFQQSTVNEKKYVMHDLMNDLARFVAAQEKQCMWLDEDLDLPEEYDYENVRHASFISSEYEILKRFINFSELKHLRSFVALPKSAETRFLSYNVLHELLPKLTCLRVLSLPQFTISVLPDTIGDLKLLRHLNLSWSHITRLPDSIGALYNLLTLNLYECSYLVELPKDIKNLINLLTLELAHTTRLEKMPSGIRALIKLQTLSKFVVSKSDKHQIQELQGLTRLRGQLFIYGLENVEDIQDVRIANLKEKNGLDEIALIWSNEFHETRDEGREMAVLESLKPTQNLKELRIESYGGNDFPSWLGDPLFANMVRITLLGCRKSKSLPSLGGLFSLKYLHIEGMDKVESVGSEFYGVEFSSNKYFPNLETLKFKNMLRWVDWNSPGVEEFPHLHELKIINCHKLKGNLPRKLPSLIVLKISYCPELKSSFVSLPSLVKLRVRECNENVLRSMVDLKSLTTLYIEKMSGLSYLDEVLMKSLERVVDLHIDSCEELTCLWKTREHLPNLVTSEELTHTSCGLKFLKRLTIKECKALETLPDWQMDENNHNQCVLEEFDIRSCPLVRSLHSYRLPTMLKKLSIRHCQNLESLPEGILHDGDENGIISCHLEDLTIWVTSLNSFPPGKFPRTLQRLFISGIKQLEPLSSEENFEKKSMLQTMCLDNYPSQHSLPIGLGRLMHLTTLVLSNCDALESFPENVLLSTPKLNSLSIVSCENLKSLPNEMHKLISLQTLVLLCCPSIIEFPEGGLPPNITSLTMSNLKNLKQPMSEWGLNTLTTLTNLYLWSHICSTDEIVSFPGCIQLPSSITRIDLSELKNVESISSSLKSLTSLRCLYLIKCPKLKSLPEEGLPDSLGELVLKNCPLLGKRCIKEKEDYWHLIAHIPHIKISRYSGEESYSKKYSGGFLLPDGPDLY